MKGMRIMRSLVFSLLCAAALQAPAQTSVSINVDLAKSQGVYKPIYSWFGYDEGNYTTMKYGKQLLTELHDLSPVPVYIRAPPFAYLRRDLEWATHVSVQATA